MNLHAVVSGAIGAVNPPVPAVLWTYTGATKNPDYSRTANYVQTSVSAQVQPLSSQELRQLAAMNLTTVDRKAYLFGAVAGVNRATGQGGDLLQFNGQYWLVTAVPEAWDQAGWTCVGLTEQVNPPS